MGSGVHESLSLCVFWAGSAGKGEVKFFSLGHDGGSGGMECMTPGVKMSLVYVVKRRRGEGEGGCAGVVKEGGWGGLVMCWGKE